MFDLLYVPLIFLCFDKTLGSNRNVANRHWEGQLQRQTPSLPPGFYVIQPDEFFLSGLLAPKDYEWFTRNVPFIDFPDDDDILTTYYYRWKVYKKHIRFIEE